MVIGKRRITEDMRQAAVNRLTEVCALARTLMAQADSEGVEEMELPDSVPESWTEEFEYVGADLFEAYAEMEAQDIVDKVAKAVAFLDAPDLRDCASRNISDDEFVLFCGEMTWGDEPEGGGYQMLKSLFMLGIDEELGLR
jgi:hypothetical protein